MEREANERKVYMSDCINYSRLEMYIFSLELDKYLISGYKSPQFHGKCFIYAISFSNLYLVYPSETMFLQRWENDSNSNNSELFFPIGWN